MYLFDASALVNLVKKDMVKPLAKGATIDLALYESPNAVWRKHRLLGRIDEETTLIRGRYQRHVQRHRGVDGEGP